MVLQHLITALSNLFIIVADGIQNVKVNLRTQIIVSMAVAIDSIEVNYFYDARVCLQFYCHLRILQRNYFVLRPLDGALRLKSALLLDY